MEQEIITYEPPREYTINNVVFWEPTSNQLRLEKKGKALLTKAKNFLENNCIRRTPQSLTSWEFLPIKDYNKTTHKIRLTEQGWVCTCQGFNKSLKEFAEGHTDIKPICSHILAVKQLNFMRENNDI